MKFMLISYATKDWEAGLPPDPRLLVALPRLWQNMPKGGALLGTGGLAPSSVGAKVRVSGGKVLVTDGPFTETKELVGGFAIVDVGSKEEAIAIAKGFWQLHVDVLGPSYEGGGEIRQMFHQEECAPPHQQASGQVQLGSGPEHRRLEPFVGNRKTEGTIKASNQLVLAFREPGPSWVSGVPTREQPLWEDHAAFMDSLFARGQVVLAGPYADYSRALVILNVGDAVEASAILRDDPWEKAEILVPGQIIEWVVYLDSRKPT